jgi:hypothetical protein
MALETMVAALRTCVATALATRVDAKLAAGSES